MRPNTPAPRRYHKQVQVDVGSRVELRDCFADTRPFLAATAGRFSDRSTHADRTSKSTPTAMRPRWTYRANVSAAIRRFAARPMTTASTAGGSDRR